MLTANADQTELLRRFTEQVKSLEIQKNRTIEMLHLVYSANGGYEVDIVYKPEPGPAEPET